MSAPRIVCTYCGLGPLDGKALKRVGGGKALMRVGLGVYICQGGHTLAERREWRKRQEDNRSQSRPCETDKPLIILPYFSTERPPATAKV